MYPINPSGRTVTLPVQYPQLHVFVPNWNIGNYFLPNILTCQFWKLVEKALPFYRVTDVPFGQKWTNELKLVLGNRLGRERCTRYGYMTEM